MSKNISILLSLIFIFLTAYFLYWKSEKDFQRASSNFSVLAFENTDLNCQEKSFEFFIKNNLLEKNKYKVSIEINDSNFKNFEVSIPAQEQINIPIEPNELTSLCQEKNRFKYKVKIEKKSDKQEIYKFIN